jgi:outer membrane autotransporter protein
MKINTFVNPVSGKASVRSKQLIGCAAVALAFGAFAPSAYAADECGLAIAGTVTCAPAGNPYATGITYAAVADINVSAPAGVIVNTALPATNGITITGIGAATLSGGATVATTGIGSNGVQVTSSGGPVTINAGRTTVTGAGGNAIFAQGAGIVNVTSNGASAVDATAIVARSTASTATVNLASGAVNSASGIGIDVTGTSANVSTASGTTVSGGSLGVLMTSANGNSLVNAGTISGGTYAIATNGGTAMITNNGTINGAVNLGGSGAVVNNTGNFNALGTSTFGSGGRFNNIGLVAVGPSSTVPTSATFSGLGTFNNSGTISMANGHTGDALTLSGNYVGSGNAALVVDVAPGTVIDADKLNIGGSATGSTVLNIVLPVGSQPLFNTGTVIVQTGAGSSATAFGVSAQTANAGLVRYDVAYNPLTTRYSVVAVPGDAAYNMLTFGTAERNLWNKSADAVTAQMQSRRDALWSLGGTAPAGKFWMTMAGSVDTVHGTRDFSTLGTQHVTDTGYTQDYFGGQIGLGLSDGVSTRGGFAVGITGGYINSRAKLGGTADKISFNAVNGGAYASFTSGNIFFNALGKYDHYWADAASNSAGYQAKLKGSAYGARGEFGLRFGGDSFFMEPVAQLSYLHTSLDSFSVQGTNVSFDGRDGLRGKAGARIGGVTALGEDSKMSFYAGANYVHDFKDEGRVTFANTGGTYSVSRFRMPDYGEAVAGFTIASSNSVSGFMEATYTRTFKSGSGASATLEGAGGRAGLSFKF